jgi:thiamine transporter
MRTKTMTVCATCIALALVLSLVPALEMPQGGSLTAGRMFFIALTGFWFGPAAGLISGVAEGLLELIIKPEFVHPAQLLLDYPLAFGLIGLLGGCFRSVKFGLPIGYLAGVFGRYVMHTVSGAIFFAEYAPVGQNAWVYSAGYNLTYIGPEALITLIVISIPAFKNVVEHVGKTVTQGNTAN